jgi:hypothetical protein
MGSQPESTKRSQHGARFSQAGRDDLHIRSDMPHMTETLRGRTARQGPCYNVRETSKAPFISFAPGREAMHDERLLRRTEDRREPVYVSSMGAQASSQKQSAPAYRAMTADRPRSVLSGLPQGQPYTPETAFLLLGQSDAVGKYHVERASRKARRSAPQYSFSQAFLHEASRPPWAGLQPIAVRQHERRFVRGLPDWKGASGGDLSGDPRRPWTAGGTTGGDASAVGNRRRRRRRRRPIRSSAGGHRPTMTARHREKTSRAPRIPAPHCPAMMRRLEAADRVAHAQASVLSTSLQHPSFGFGKASRRGPETWLRGPDILTAYQNPGPGTYGGPPRLQQYETSCHRTSPSFGFGRSSRFASAMYHAHGDHTRRSDISIARKGASRNTKNT